MERSKPDETATRLRLLLGACGERVHLVRVVDPDFRHRELRLLRQPLDGAIEPVRLIASRAAVDNLYAHCPLGHPPRQLQRDERASHAPDEAEGRQGPDVQAGGTGVTADPQNGQQDRQDEDNRDIGEDQQKNALRHRCSIV
jgi:hypothetical protein